MCVRARWEMSLALKFYPTDKRKYNPSLSKPQDLMDAGSKEANKGLEDDLISARMNQWTDRQKALHR